MEAGFEPLRLLNDKLKSSSNLNHWISWGIEPERLFSKRYKVVKFLKFPIEGGIGPMRLLVVNWRSLSDVNNPISWGIEPYSLFVWRYNSSSFL